MHREFRELLTDARGVSEFPIAMNIDIRGFSKWSGDSAQAGLFIKKVYIRLIDHFLSDASFYKATGDGLMAILPVDENDPKAAIRNAVDLAFGIVEAFPTITEGDPMINFPTPEKVGVGLARGPASRLVSGDKTLDYSGGTLNLASRLMDLARPEGVVLDEHFGYDLLVPSIAEKFESTKVYIRGISPNVGREVYFTRDWTTIPESAKHPLDAARWGGGQVELARSEFDELIGEFIVELDSRPKDPGDISCYVKHDAPTKNGNRSKSKWIRLDLSATNYVFEETSSGPVLRVKVKEIQRVLAITKAGPKFPVRLLAEFRAS
jgi:class 3 adenylate cyclase